TEQLRRRYCSSPHRSSIFIIYFHRLVITFGKCGERDFARVEIIDETISHWRSVCSFDRLFPLAAARGGANVHLCSHHTKCTKASTIQARAGDECYKGCDSD